MIAKRALKQAIRRSSVLRFHRALQARSLLVLYYHSVCDNAEQQSNYISTGIVTSARSFRSHMEVLRSDYHPVTLNEVLQWIDGQIELPQNSVAVTFDDGFADNYEVAAPIMEELGIYGTFYLTAGCIEQQTLPWFCKIRYLLEQGVAKGVTIVDENTQLRCDLSRPNGYQQGWRYFGECCAKLAGPQQDLWISDLEEKIGARYDDAGAPRMMTWDNARELATRGHILGNHTMTHPNMAYLSYTDQAAEITAAHQLLSDRLNMPVEHFSYPHPCLNPQWDYTSQSMLQALRYKTLVLTQPGNITRASSPWELNRISVSESSVDEFRWKLECSFANVII